MKANLPKIASETSAAWDFIMTRDGSPTLFDCDYNEHHHSMVGAHTEAMGKFVKEASPILLNRSKLRILDLPFGLGYNFIATLEYLLNNQHRPENQFIYCDAIEKNPEVLARIKDFPTDHNLKRHFDLIAKVSEGYPIILSRQHNFKLQVLIGDLIYLLNELVEPYDVIYYDPFSPRVAPHFWSKQRVLSHLARLLKPDGLLITYTSSNKVRKGLIELGLSVCPSASIGRKMPGTLASKDKNLISKKFSPETESLINKAQTYP